MTNNKTKTVEKSKSEVNPELAQQFQDIIRYVETTPFHKMFPNKHRVIMEDSVKEKTYKLFKENSNQPLHKVVAKVLAQLSDVGMSAELIVKMTHVIIKEWEELSLSTASKQVKELV
jgi:hypothetical protein